VIALAVVCGLALLAVIAVAWWSLPTPPPPPVIAFTPPRRVDHRTREQREADQAKVNEAWGLR
jgi:hypothetical protein